MKVSIQKCLIILLSIVLIIPLALAQSEIVARVVSASGRVEVERADGSRETLQRRSNIYVGDSIESFADAFLQLRFIDSAILSLGSDSMLNVRKYQYQNLDSDRVELYLAAGSMRTITGSIQGMNYSLVTDVATVKPARADYETVVERENLLYFAVYDGGINVSNVQGSLYLGVDADADFASVEIGSAPVGLIHQPLSLGVPIVNIR